MSSTDMPVGAAAETPREAYHAQLMAHAYGQSNDHALACMWASWVSGNSALPENWGLSPTEFKNLLRFHFPGFDPGIHLASEIAPASLRHEEQAELVELMKSHRAGLSPSEAWMASVVATACLGNDHLWQDLGLWCRDDLTRLMRHNFPVLAGKNIHNMKWKKFLYKQLCIAEGIYVCRSPSCEVCADYQDCFGPED